MKLEVFFDCSSPWAYLGFEKVQAFTRSVQIAQGGQFRHHECRVVREVRQQCFHGSKRFHRMSVVAGECVVRATDCNK